jgi:hypothetical protein
MKNIFSSLLFSLLLLFGVCHGQNKQQSYCNPMILDYGFTPIPTFAEWGKHRVTADPVITQYQGDYYLFSTYQMGYWRSNERPYYFHIEAVNENGVSQRTKILRSE